MVWKRTIENSDKYDTRRIFLEDEAKEIIHLQSGATEFYEYHPKYSQWLQNTVKEIVDGNRIAFGVFGTGYTKDKKPRVELVGSIILKSEVYTNTVKLDNLFIRSDARRVKNGTTLCNVAENYCAKQGYSRIMTEVPANEYGAIKFLLERDYKILAIKESPYKVKQQLYEIYKNLTPLYGEDFFDLYSISKWLLNVVYDFKNIKGNNENYTITFDLDIKVDSRYDVERIAPKGLAIVLDKDNIRYNEIDEKFLNCRSKYNLVFVFGQTFETETLIRCKDSGLIVFSQLDISQKFKNLFIYKLPEFRKKEIGGIIVSINPEHFDRIKRDNKIFTYLKAGSIGKYLHKNDKIIFYSEPSQKYPIHGIKGCGDIMEVYHGDPNETWREVKEKNPFFTYDQYKSYVQKKKSILGLVVDNFRAFETFSFENLEQIFDNFTTIDDICNNYISKNTVAGFSQIVNESLLIEDNQKAMKNKYKYSIALSFADENREIVDGIAKTLREKGISVFYDHFERHKLWGKRLSQYFQETYGKETRFVVPFISKEYSIKDWTDFEFTIAHGEAKNRENEFILPVRIDDTPIVGLPRDMAYLDYNKEGIDGIVENILLKLNS